MLKITQRANTGEKLWTLTDHLGSVRDVVDNNGVVRQHVAYDSFGNRINEIDRDASGNIISSTDPAAIDELFGYTGRDWDSDVELQNNRARWYDPQQGRWLSKDPIGFAAGDANLYWYVGNGPTNYIALDGLNKVKVIYKIGEHIVKVTNISVHEARSILRARTKDAAKPKTQRKYSQDAKVFVSTCDDKTTKDLAKKASPTGEAVYHPPTNGYPGHYHPVKKHNSKGKPETGGTPHISPDYKGHGSVAFGLGILEQGGEIVIDLTPVGDVHDIITGVPEIVSGTCEAIEITTAERVRDWELRTQAGILGQRQISTIRPGEGEKKPLRAGSWRDPNPFRW